MTTPEPDATAAPTTAPRRRAKPGAEAARRRRTTRAGFALLVVVAAGIVALALLGRARQPAADDPEAARLAAAAAEAASAASAAAASAARSFVPRPSFGAARSDAAQEAVVGGQPRAPSLPPDTLRGFLPETLAGLQRTSMRVTSGQGLAFGGASAEATYANPERSATVRIVDAAGVARHNAVAPWAGQVGAREDDQAREQVWQDGERMVREHCRREGQQCDLEVLLPNGVLVQASARDIPYAELKRAVDAMELGRLQGLARPAAPAGSAPAAAAASTPR